MIKIKASVPLLNNQKEALMYKILSLSALLFLVSCTAYKPSGNLGAKGENAGQTIVQEEVTEFPVALEEPASAPEGSVVVSEGQAEEADPKVDGKVVSKELIEIVQEDLGPSPYANVPLDYNPKVQKWLDYFQGRGRGHMNRYLGRSSRYLGLMKSILAEERLPERLAYLPLIESGFNHSAHSHASAVGYWQFIYGTGKIFGLEINNFIDERRDPIRSTEAAVQYLSSLYKMFDDWYLSLAAYNTGEGRIKRYIRNYKTKDYWVMSTRRMHKETKNYVPKYIAAVMIIENPSAYGFNDVPFEDPLHFESIDVKKGISLKKLAASLNVPEKVFLRLNPKYRSEYVPGTSKKPMEVRVPVGKMQIASSFIDSSAIAAPKNLRGDHFWYRVKRGDNLSVIAKKHRTTTSTLRRLNRMGRRSFLRAGQKLKVPQRYAKSSYKVASRKAKKPSRYHKVKKGETLSEIAEAYGAGLSQVRRWNNLNRRSLIRVGQKLIVGTKKNSTSSVAVDSSATHHKVRSGENLTMIAKKYGLSVSSLKANNSLARSTIKPGQKLVLRRSKPSFKDKSSVAITGHRLADSHKVKSGENLTMIAKKYGLSTAHLKKINKLSRSTIQPGQKLKLRAPASIQTHIVKNGENLTLIAKKYGVSVSELIRKNQLGRRGNIFPGQKLKIASNQ